jgi:hypothetical protein
MGVTRDVSHCTKGLWRRLHLPLRRARVAQAPQLKEAASARAIVGDQDVRTRSGAERAWDDKSARKCVLVVNASLATVVLRPTCLGAGY